MLKVPFIYQFHKNACGAAVLEMVYRYYGLNDIDQREIFEKYKELEPHGSGVFRIRTSDLVRDAKDRGFDSFWKQANFNNPKESIQLLKEFVGQSIPAIVCQQYTKEEPLMGHFRVVFRVNDKNVYFHDPHPETGGPSIKWSIEKFMDFWQPTGENVIGGVYIIIKK